jgi:ferric-dicitrate binding protein FerR (iron transport regulator)
VLDDASSGVETALERHPSVRHILDRIREDADDFTRCWDDAFSESDAPPAPGVDRPPVPSRHGLRLVRRPWIAAAAVIAVIAVTSLLRPGRDTRNLTVHSADAGTFLPVELPDGTLARLAGPATLSFDAGHPRSVRLDGSAFFDVRTTGDPFTINTPRGDIGVLGTTFGVHSGDTSTEVTLVTGSLELRSPDGSNVRLSPGERSRLTGSGGPAPPERVDITRVLRWTGLFVFRDTPLDEVARTLSEEFDVKIDVSEDLRAETLTGTFAQEQGAVEILRVISAAVSAKLDIADDRSSFKISR